MAPDDQKTAGHQAMYHFLKSRGFERLFVVSEEVISQEDEMKVPIWGVVQEMMKFP